MSDGPSLAPGARLGPYAVAHELGRGSSAAVYLGMPADDDAPPMRQPAAAPRQSEVAIKVRRRGDERLDRRFLREVESLRALRVPGVARVHGAGQTGELLWYAMDVVTGVDLRRFIHDQGGMDRRVAAAAHVGARLLDVLSALHRRGLVHRDIKPSNVLVDEDGKVYVLDLGVVGLWSHGGTLTGSGRLVGTVPYMAPEQVASQPVTAAADIFATGLMLLEGLLGPRPRPDRPQRWVEQQLLERPPSPAVVDRQIPCSLSAAIDAMLAFDPNARPSADAAAGMLRGVAAGRTRGAWPAPHRVHGRDALIADILRAFDDATLPRLHLLAGPAGAGRHRVAEELARRALARQVPSMRTACRQDDPGGAVGGLLERLLQHPPDPLRRRRIAGEVGHTLLEMWPGLPLEDTGGQSQPTSARGVAEAAAGAIARAAEPDGLLIVIEDLDQVDPFTERTLTELSRLAPKNMLLLALHDPRWSSERCRRLLARLGPTKNLRTTVMVDLTVDAVGAIVGDLAPDGARGVLGPSSPQRAVETGLRRLASSRQERFSDLPVECVPLGVARGPLPEPALRKLHIDARRMVEGGTLHEPRPGVFELADPVFRRQACALLDDRVAAEDLLAGALSESPDEAHQAMIASHLLHGSKPNEALVPAIRAAIHATLHHHYQDARRWLMVVDQLPRDRLDPRYQQLRFELAWCRGMTSMRTDGVRIRSDLVAQASKRAQDQEDRERAAMLRVRLMARQGRLELAIAECRERADALSSLAPELSAMALRVEAELRLDQQDPQAALQRLDREEVLRGGRGAGRVDLEADLLRIDALDEAGASRLAVDRCREAVAKARIGGLAALESSLGARLGIALMNVGERDAAEEMLWSAAADLQQRMDPVRAAEASVWLGRLSIGRGDGQAGAVRATAALAVARAFGARRLVPDALAVLVDAAHAQGDSGVAFRAMDDFRVLGIEHPRFYAACQRWLRARGDLERALALASPQRPTGAGAVEALVEQARTLLAAGRREAAEPLLASAADEAREHGYRELALLTRLVQGAARPHRDGGWSYALSQAEGSSWLELSLGALELDARRALSIGDVPGARRQLLALARRAADLGHDGWSRVAEGGLAQVERR